MPADALTTLRNLTAQQRARLSRTHPQALTLFSSATTKNTTQAPHTPEIPELTEAMQQTVSDMTRDEYFTIIKKLQDAAKLKAGTLDADLELYLEQQLEDLFGFEVTTEYKSLRLPHTIGTMQSLPHYKRTPTDTSTQHARVTEAGFSLLRSNFGWMNPEEYAQESIRMREVYGVALPQSADHSLQDYIRKWKHIKLLVLNPFEYRGVIARVTDTFSPLSPKYQFGGTPELIRDGLCWSPQTLGRVLLFILPDEKDELLPGPINCIAPEA